MSKLYFALLTAVVGLASQRAEAITLGFSSIDDSSAKLIFDGSTDTFKFGNAISGPGVGYSFSITESDGLGDSLGLFGSIEGTFNIGAVVNGEATVSGSGTVLLQGGFVANVSFDTIFKTRATGGIEGEFNLSNIVYSGSNADLLALQAGAPGEANLSFTISGMTLSDILASGTPVSTSYDGEFVASVPDGGATALLLGIGSLGLALFRRKS